jgi:hypothetical protein
MFKVEVPIGNFVALDESFRVIYILWGGPGVSSTSTSTSDLKVGDENGLQIRNQEVRLDLKQL